jgi:hypothetical protein
MLVSAINYSLAHLWYFNNMLGKIFRASGADSRSFAGNRLLGETQSPRVYPKRFAAKSPIVQ